MKIVEKEGNSIVKFDNPSVAIICYDEDQSGVISTIGVVKETNSLFSEGFSESLVMGMIEDNDGSLLERAMLLLKKEASFEITDVTKWSYLGEMHLSKISPDSIYLFSVNVSGSTPQVSSEDEKTTAFSMIPAQDIMKIGDAVLLASFFKLFMNVYSRDFKPVTI